MRQALAGVLLVQMSRGGVAGGGEAAPGGEGRCSAAPVSHATGQQTAIAHEGRGQGMLTSNLGCC